MLQDARDNNEEGLRLVNDAPTLGGTCQTQVSIDKKFKTMKMQSSLILPKVSLRLEEGLVPGEDYRGLDSLHHLQH